MITHLLERITGIQIEGYQNPERMRHMYQNNGIEKIKEKNLCFLQ